jgi:hypothetical protein
MTRSRTLQLLLLVVITVGLYHWFGVSGSLFAGLIIFVLYELFMPPLRYRRFGLDQMMRQAIEQGVGIFGRPHREDEVSPESTPKVGRNNPCPCGSGLKYKRCHGRTGFSKD